MTWTTLQNNSMYSHEYFYVQTAETCIHRTIAINTSYSYSPSTHPSSPSTHSNTHTWNKKLRCSHGQTKDGILYALPVHKCIVIFFLHFSCPCQHFGTIFKFFFPHFFNIHWYTTHSLTKRKINNCIQHHDRCRYILHGTKKLKLETRNKTGRCRNTKQ